MKWTGNKKNLTHFPFSMLFIKPCAWFFKFLERGYRYVFFSFIILAYTQRQLSGIIMYVFAENKKKKKVISILCYISIKTKARDPLHCVRLLQCTVNFKLIFLACLISTWYLHAYMYNLFFFCPEFLFLIAHWKRVSNVNMCTYRFFFREMRWKIQWFGERENPDVIEREKRLKKIEFYISKIWFLTWIL